METLSGAALVVGGASGIGRACADALERDGWDVVVADLRPDRSAHGEDGRRARPRARERGGRPGRDRARATGDRGLLGRHRTVTPLLDISSAEWELVAGVNLTGAFNVLTACVPHIVPGGSFTLISSVDSQAPVAGLAITPPQRPVAKR